MVAELVKAITIVMAPHAKTITAIPNPGAEALERQRARNLEGDVADEEQRCAEAVGGFRHLQIREHLQLGESDVLAVQKRGEEYENQNRQQPPAEAPHQRPFARQRIHRNQPHASPSQMANFKELMAVELPTKEAGRPAVRRLPSILDNLVSEK